MCFPLVQYHNHCTRMLIHNGNNCRPLVFLFEPVILWIIHDGINHRGELCLAQHPSINTQPVLAYGIHRESRGLNPHTPHIGRRRAEFQLCDSVCLVYQRHARDRLMPTNRHPLGTQRDFAPKGVRFRPLCKGVASSFHTFCMQNKRSQR